MFSFTRENNINLFSSRLKCPYMAPNAKQNQLCDIAEIKTDTSSVGTSVFAYFVPNNIGFINKSPSPHYFKSLKD